MAAPLDFLANNFDCFRYRPILPTGKSKPDLDDCERALVLGSYFPFPILFIGTYSLDFCYFYTAFYTGGADILALTFYV